MASATEKQMDVLELQFDRLIGEGSIQQLVEVMQDLDLEVPENRRRNVLLREIRKHVYSNLGEEVEINIKYLQQILGLAQRIIEEEDEEMEEGDKFGDAQEEDLASNLGGNFRNLPPPFLSP